MDLVGKPRVLLFAADDIKCGLEMRYDYGEGNLPWQKVIFFYFFFIFYSNITVNYSCLSNAIHCLEQNRKSLWVCVRVCARVFWAHYL